MLPDWTGGVAEDARSGRRRENRPTAMNAERVERVVVANNDFIATRNSRRRGQFSPMATPPPHQHETRSGSDRDEPRHDAGKPSRAPSVFPFISHSTTDPAETRRGCRRLSAAKAEVPKKPLAVALPPLNPNQPTRANRRPTSVRTMLLANRVSG